MGGTGATGTTDEAVLGAHGRSHVIEGRRLPC